MLIERSPRKPQDTITVENIFRACAVNLSKFGGLFLIGELSVAKFIRRIGGLCSVKANRVGSHGG